MTATLTESSTDQVHLLVVDDQVEIYGDIRTALGDEFFTFSCCQSVDEVATIELDVQFQACILDIRLKEGATRITDLLDIVQNRWPTAVVIVLSNFIPDLDDESKIHVTPLSKMRFRQDPSTLRTALVKALVDENLISEELLHAIVENSKSDASPNAEIELYRMKGLIVEIQEPYVEVLIQEEKRGETVLRKIFSGGFYTDLLRPSESGGKRLRMTYANFKAAGLGQEMPFIYRIFRKGNQTISEVIPDDDWEASAQSVDLDPELERLREREDALVEQELQKIRKRRG